MNEHRNLRNEHRHSSSSSNDSNSDPQLRASTRRRQQRVTVSLPMIRLEIPVDQDSNFLDLTSQHRPLCNTDSFRRTPDSQVPDLIRSTQETLSNRSPQSVVESVSEPESSGSGSDNEPSHRHSNSHSENDASPGEAPAGAGANDDLMRALDSHIKKAINEGRPPYCIYNINENDDDTWC